LRRMLIAALCCSLLAGCFSRPRAVVVERSTEPAVSRSSRPAPRTTVREYLVVRGDTLYGIAFRHGVDFRELARWNGIASPYTIYPGQRLRLGAASRPTVAATRSTPAPVAPPRSSPVAPTSNSITGMPAPRSSVPTRTAAATPATPEPAPAPVASKPQAAAASTTSATPPLASLNAHGVSWRWPASGQIVSRYLAGDPTRQGVNIAGNGGQPVYAAAAGDVVYSGAGLIGYGELVIIKHSDEFLSAYGHNRKRLVAEGQRVTAGQQIAEMGRSGAARDMLHFEIRRNGKPVDPLPLLPKR
jgi:lipoprotein NlpD